MINRQHILSSNCDYREDTKEKKTCVGLIFMVIISIFYQATVTRDNTKEKKTDVGHAEGEFKTRYNGHVS
jgi:hypothetical protein